MAESGLYVHFSVGRSMGGVGEGVQLCRRSDGNDFDEAFGTALCDDACLFAVVFPAHACPRASVGACTLR